MVAEDKNRQAKPVNAEERPVEVEESRGTKVIETFPDGSSAETTAEKLSGSHGDAMGGPTVGDLNPAFDPSASTHAGAAK